jgi:hypothetical protein
VLNCRSEHQTRVHTRISITAEQSSLSSEEEGGSRKSKGEGGQRPKKQSRATEGAKQMKEGEGRANRGETTGTYGQKVVEASRIEKGAESWMEAALPPGSRCSAAFFSFPLPSLYLPPTLKWRGFQMGRLLAEV